MLRMKCVTSDMLTIQPLLITEEKNSYLVYDLNPGFMFYMQVYY